MADPLDFDDYDGLITSIGETLNRSDLDDQIPGWIVLAEEHHKADLRIKEMLETEEVEVDGRTIALPTRYVKMKRLRMLEETGGRPWKMTELTSDEMTAKWRSPSQVGYRLPDGRPTNLPFYFSVDGEIEFEVDPTEFTGATNPIAEIKFYQSFLALSTSNTSNALLLRSPGSYFYGALVHSAPFLLDDDRVPLWGSAYQSCVTKLNMTDRDRGGPQASRVAGPTP